MRRRGQLRDPAWVAVVLVCTAAVASVLTMAASRLLIPAERAVIPTSAWPWSSDGVVVLPFSAGSGFRTGDVVVAIDGRPLADWASDALRPPWFVAGPRLGSSASYEVVRDGVRSTFTAPIQPFPEDRLGGAPLGLVAFGSTALILALVLIFRRPQAIALRLLIVGVTCDIADIVAWETGLQPSDLVQRTPFLYAFAAGAIFSLIFWSSLIHLLATYPVRARWLVRRPDSAALIYAIPIAVFVLGALVAALLGGTTLDWIERLGPWTAAISSASLVAILVAVVAGYRRTPLPRRPQVRLLAGTLSVAAAATLVLVSLPIALSREPVAPRGIVALLALPVVAALALAVIRDHLFQVDLLASSRARIVAAREEERLRLRRELHDGLGPTLAALGLKIDAAREQAAGSDPTAVRATLEEIRGDVRGILAQIRGLARELRPPSLDSLGLVGGLRQQLDTLAAGAPTRVELIADDLPELTPGIEVAAYRIVVESVTNVLRHADAMSATVRLRIEHDVLRIDVDDDGVGVASGAIGVGTRAMYERAAEVGGELTIEPGPVRGTRVTALLPLGSRRGTTAEPAGDAAVASVIATSEVE